MMTIRLSSIEWRVRPDAPILYDVDVVFGNKKMKIDKFILYDVDMMLDECLMNRLDIDLAEGDVCEVFRDGRLICTGMAAEIS